MEFFTFNLILILIEGAGVHVGGTYSEDRATALPLVADDTTLHWSLVCFHCDALNVPERRLLSYHFGGLGEES